jgi:hypothetical protein
MDVNRMHGRRVGPRIVGGRCCCCRCRRSLGGFVPTEAAGAASVATRRTHRRPTRAGRGRKGRRRRKGRPRYRRSAVQRRDSPYQATPSLLLEKHSSMLAIVGNKAGGKRLEFCQRSETKEGKCGVAVVVTCWLNHALVIRSAFPPNHHHPSATLR